LSILEEGRYREKRTEPDDSGEIEPLFEAFDLGELVKHAKAELGSQHPVARMVVDSQRQIKSGIERVQEVFSRLLLSAGLGHMIDVVIHEIGSPLGKINRQIAVLVRDLKNILEAAEWDRIEPKFESMKGWLEQIHGMRQRLEPHTPAKRGRATQFDVIEEVNDNIDLYEALIRKQNIQYTISSSVESLWVKMSRAALGQVLANLIDNSIYWLIRKHGSGNGGRLSISIEPADQGFSVVVSDDGEGVSEEDQAIIFEPYFTRKADGMGLGLYIARLLIEPYGKLLYRDDCDLGGACFEATFEKGVGL
jgi:signal transduction histidine kinase